MTEHRICKDCLNYDAAGESCRRVYEGGKIDLVTGVVSAGIAGFDAHYERGNDTHRMGEGLRRNLCGPSGRFFKAKKATDAPPKDGLSRSGIPHLG